MTPDALVYALHRCADGQWLVLDRRYKPFGQRLTCADWVEYDAVAGVRLRLTDAQVHRLVHGCVPYRPGDAQCWLFSDATSPTLGGPHLQDYERRVQLLWAMTPTAAPPVPTTPTPPTPTPTLRIERDEDEDDPPTVLTPTVRPTPTPTPTPTSPEPRVPLVARWSRALSNHRPTDLARTVVADEIAATEAAAAHVLEWVATYAKTLHARRTRESDE